MLHHGEIRYRILAVLYIKYYYVDPERTFIIDHIINEARLTNEIGTRIKGDIKYLIDKKLIDSFNPIGNYNTLIKINVDGIDAVEATPRKVIQRFEKSNDENLKKLLQELSQEVTSTERIVNTFNKIRSLNLSRYIQIMNTFRDLLENPNVFNFFNDFDFGTSINF